MVQKKAVTPTPEPESVAAAPVELEPSQIETLPTVTPDAAPPAENLLAAPVPANPQMFTLADVAAFLKPFLEQQSASSRELIIETVKELKKPTPEEEERRAKEKARVLKLHEMRVNEARTAEESRNRAQSACRHLKKNGDPAWGGQVNSDGYVRPICCICLKVMPEIKAPVEWIQNGVNFQDKEAFPALTEAMLLGWHKALGPKPKTIKPELPPLVNKPEVQSIVTPVQPAVAV